MRNENIEDLHKELKELKLGRRLARLFLIGGIILLGLSIFMYTLTLSICGALSVIISVLWAHIVKKHREEVQDNLDAERWKEESNRKARRIEHY